MTRRYARAWASLFFCAFLPLSGTVFAQTSNVSPAPTPAAQAPNPQATVNTLAGKILKKDGRYVLHESASKTDYVLDDQKVGKRYNGKVVFVTGVVDQTDKTIHDIKKVEVAA